MRIQKQANTGMNTHGVLMIWLDPKMHWHGEATGKPGRSPTFRDAAVQFCLAVKNVLDVPLRQAMQATKKLLQATALNWPVPNFSTISHRRKKLRKVFIDLTDTSELHLIVDDGIQIMTLSAFPSTNWAGNHRQWAKVQLSVELK